MTKHPPGGKSMANRTYLPASDISRRFERRRADRERAKKASGEWLQISEIISAVVKKEGATFDDNKRNKIAIEVCGRIVSDSSDGKLGTKRSPALMLLSEDYDEITLKPSELAQNLKNAFDGLNSEKRRQSIATFLTDHFWMRRVAAAKWLGPEIPLPRHIRPAQESISKTRAADRAECLSWLKSEMEASEERPKKFDDFFEEAKHRFKVTVRTFRALWDQAIDETESYEWRKAGRPKKS